MGDSVAGCVQSQFMDPLSREEAALDWRRVRCLGIGHPFFGTKLPHFGREDLPDPWRYAMCGATPAQIPCGFAARPHDGGGYDWLPIGFRATAPEHRLVTAKVTETDPHVVPTAEAMVTAVRAYRGMPMEEPMSSMAGGRGSAVATPERLFAKSTVQRRPLEGASVAAAAARVQRLEASALLRDSTAAREQLQMRENVTPRGGASDLMVEAGRRLLLNGYGSLNTLVAAGASDEALSHILRAVGFGDAQRVAILWDLRRSRMGTSSKR